MTAAPVLVRDARPADGEAVRALTAAAYAEYAAAMEPAAWAGLAAAVSRALASPTPAQQIVAERAGAVIGSVLLYPPAVDAYGGLAGSVPWPEVRLLAVSPTARGLGVGQRLMDECARRARAAGAADLGLHTSRSMRSAMRLYERMGFVRAPEHDFQPPGAERVEAYRLALAPGR